MTAELGCSYFQVYVTHGGMLASNMDKAARADFAALYRDLGLTLSATCGDFGLNFGNSAMMAEKEPLLRDAVIQSGDLGARIMTTHIGVLEEGGDGKAREIMITQLKRLGDFSADHGITLATETGLEPGPRLRKMLEEAGTEGIGVNFDPANLVMNGYNHLEAVRELHPFIVHTHAKDGYRRADGSCGEVPLGKGDVDFPSYVGLLRKLGYDGVYCIERESGEDRIGDIRRAAAFLKAL
jgi:sugar phosphate isomerase/epimerase